MYENLLVPLDGSKLAEQVLPYVIALAQAFASEITLIDICEPGEKDNGENCSLYIRGVADRLRQSLLVPVADKVKSSIFYGKAASEILRYAEEKAVSLIIMASHGSSGLVPWSLGSTVHNVLQRAGLPILVIRAQEREAVIDGAALFQKIAIPLDGSENSAAVVPYITEIAGKLNSQMYLLQVVEAGRQVHTIGGLNYVPFKDQDINTRKCQAVQYLKGVAGNIGGGIGVNCVVLAGEAVKEILKFADEQECGLIAVSSHGESAISAWAHGSVTYKILQSSKQSVFFVPSPGIRR